MIRFPLIGLLAAALGASPSRAESANEPDASVIRAGRNIAMTTCLPLSCRVRRPGR
jgi:hypothetical protein